jgi:hypothetical protein
MGLKISYLLLETLLEMIDLYDPSELESKNIKLKIKSENTKGANYLLYYKEYIYEVVILKGQDGYLLGFGDITDGKDLDMTTLTNRDSTPRILSALFGLLRRYVDTFNVNSFYYDVDGELRKKLYNFYLNKHFKDFKLDQMIDNEDSTQTYIWKKI